MTETSLLRFKIGCKDLNLLFCIYIFIFDCDKYCSNFYRPETLTSPWLIPAKLRLLTTSFNLYKYDDIIIISAESYLRWRERLHYHLSSQTTLLPPPTFLLDQHPRR